MAQSNPPSTTVPYAFSKRIMAHINATPAVDSLTLWARMLWRATAPAMAVMVLMTVWANQSPTMDLPGMDDEQFEGAVVETSELFEDTW